MKKSETPLFRRMDALIFAFVILLAIILPIIGASKDDPAQLLVSVNGKETAYSLENNRSFSVENENVNLTVEIKDGKVRVTHSDCPDKVCVSSGSISKNGQIIVCAPAMISLRIIDGEGGDFDAITG